MQCLSHMSTSRFRQQTIVMTLKDPCGAYSSVKPHRKLGFCPAGRVCQGRRAHTTLRRLFRCGFRSSLCPSGPAGVGMAVLKPVQGWTKRAAGQRFLPWCRADIWPTVAVGLSMVAGLAMAAGLAWHACLCRVWRGEAGAQSRSGGRLGRDGLVQHLAVQHRDAGAAQTGSLPSHTAFQLPVLSPGFPLPSLGPQVSGHAQLHHFYASGVDILWSAGWRNALLVLARSCSGHLRM